MLAPKILDLNEVVTENLKMLTRMIGEDIDLVMVPAPELGAVRADAGQIEQVIMNLAVNARDAMPLAASSPSRPPTSHSTKSTPRYARAPATRRVRDACRSATPAWAWIRRLNPTSSSRSSPRKVRKARDWGSPPSTESSSRAADTSGYYSEPSKGTTFKIYLPRVAERAESIAQVVSPRGR